MNGNVEFFDTVLIDTPEKAEKFVDAPEKSEKYVFLILSSFAVPYAAKFCMLNLNFLKMIFFLSPRKIFYFGAEKFLWYNSRVLIRSKEKKLWILIFRF